MLALSLLWSQTGAEPPWLPSAPLEKASPYSKHLYVSTEKTYFID